MIFNKDLAKSLFLYFLQGVLDEALKFHIKMSEKVQEAKKYYKEVKLAHIYIEKSIKDLENAHKQLIIARANLWAAFIK
jgi:hypothetical protein